jgi:hypothetical protein
METAGPPPPSFPSNPAEFLNLPWYFVSDGATRGPVATRLIIHKIREGLLDGLSMVYSHIIGKWLSIAEIPEIRAMITKLDEEEDQAAALTAVQDLPTEQMVFVADEEDDSRRREFVAYCEKLAETKAAEEAARRDSAGAEPSTSKKSFVADDGKKYLWDAEEDDWVESTASDSGGEEMSEAFVDDDNDNDDVDDRDGQNNNNSASTEQPSGSEKQKRKRKNKSRSKNNKGWVYITGKIYIYILKSSSIHILPHFKCMKVCHRILQQKKSKTTFRKLVSLQSVLMISSREYESTWMKVVHVKETVLSVLMPRLV